LIGWGIRAYACVLVDGQSLAHHGVETMLIPNVAIDQFLALMRIGTRCNLCFEVFEGVMEFPDVDTILAYHPKALPNQLPVGHIFCFRGA
jgi:hypothetical protein